MSNKKPHVPSLGGPRQWDGLAGLYQDLSRWLRWRAQALLKDPEEARDVVQETFLAFMQAHPSLRGEASHSTVIQGIFIRRVINHMRQRSRCAVPIDTLGPEDDERAPSPWEAGTEHDGGCGEVEAREELAMLTRGETAQALQVAHLYFLEGHTFEETGKKLGLRRKVVSRMLQRLVGHVVRRRARLADEESADDMEPEGVES
jgi:RNA polymerase sigma factor (sigma-70 family)